MMVLALASLVVVLADPGRPADSEQTFAATADAMIREDRPNAKRGGATTLRVDASPRKHTLLRFDLAGLTGTVVAARLRLFTTDSSPAGGDVHRSADGWNELQVSWNTAPSYDAGVLGSFGSVSSGSWAEVALSPTFIDAGASTYSLRITSPSSDAAAYRAREYSPDFAPRLIVTTSSGGGTPPPCTGAPTFVGSTVNGLSGGNVSELPIDRPAGTQAGDVLVLGVAEHEVGTLTAPPGWDLIRMTQRPGDLWMWTYFKVVGSSEPSSYTLTVGDNDANAAILAYRGVSSTSPIAGNSGGTANGSTSITAPSIDVGSTCDTRLVMFATIEGPTPNTITPPAGFTERAARFVHPSFEGSDGVFAGTGSTGARTATAASAADNIGIMVALRPA